MFRKPFKVKSNNAIRGSERRKLKDHLQRSYPQLPSSDVSLLVPNKDPMSIVSILTHNDTNVTCYCLHKSPILFDVDGILLPTVYTLWKYPDMCVSFQTHANVFSILAGGADLMFPGVVPPLSGFPDFNSKTPCYVKLYGNGRAAVAVGITSCSRKDLLEDGCAGKRVTVFHCFKDQLWAFGEKEAPPSIPDVIEVADSERESEREAFDSSEGEPDQCTQLSSDVNDLDISCENGTEKKNSEAYGVENGSENLGGNLIEDDHGDYVQLLQDGDVPGEPGVPEQMEVLEQPQLTPQELQDVLIENCFYQALLDAKKVELPILVSKFSSQYLHAACPDGQRIDVKKSSYKKMSKLLSEMQSRGLVEVKELSKGVESVMKINIQNDKIAKFTKSEFAQNRKVVKQGKMEEEKKMKKQLNKTIEIQELFAVSGKVAPFFKLYQKGKGSALCLSEVRQLITLYVKDNELMNVQNKKLINLDPLLTDILFNKGSHQDSLTWDGIMTSMLKNMNPCHEVTYPGEEPVVRKGKMELIEVSTEKRMGNKMVTVVKNLESFGIDTKQFAQGLQQAAASSTAVNAMPGKVGGHLVIVQGVQMKHVKTILESHKVPLKYVKGLDLKKEKR